MKVFYIFLITLCFSCNTIQYKNSTIKVLPELGVIGVSTDYLLDRNHMPKSVVSLNNPVRLKVEIINVEKRRIFNRKDSLPSSQKDSSLVSIELLDNISLIKQLNIDKELLEYLKKGENFSIVSKTKIHFPKNILQKLKSADEFYLTQNKENTLSIEIRKDNKELQTIEFTDGKIIDINVSEFCWGLNKKRKIEIFDLVQRGTSCNKNTFKSAEKAKKKNEFKF